MASTEVYMRALIITITLIAACNDSTDVQRMPIGSPCLSSADCGTGKFFCDKDHPNGYCKASCHKDADCPSGSVCAGAGTVSPGECHKDCTQATKATDCRINEGYICKAMPADASHDYCDVPEVGDGG
jgi:hypothetical protein